jgi:hypothetical protein
MQELHKIFQFDDLNECGWKGREGKVKTLMLKWEDNINANLELSVRWNTIGSNGDVLKT